MRCSLSGVNGGLGPLDKHPALTAAAQKHSEDNARMGDLTHTGSDGSRSSDRSFIDHFTSVLRFFLQSLEGRV